MRTVWRFALAAGLIALGAQEALAQRVNRCPTGQAMTGSDPSGHTITCEPVALGETDIVGQWAVTGTTNCIQASGGFDPDTFQPTISTNPNRVTQLAATFIGTRTFYAGGTGRSVGTTHALNSPATNFVAGFPPTAGGTFGANTATLDMSFTWTIQGDGTLKIDDDNTSPQPITAPPSLIGQAITIENMPPFVGYISKDKKTILLTHPGMSLETSTRRDADGNVTGAPIPRFCARSRVMTRLP
jgi:hypothetical protein